MVNVLDGGSSPGEKRVRVKILSSPSTTDPITPHCRDKVDFPQIALHDHSKSLPVIEEVDKLVQCF